MEDKTIVRKDVSQQLLSKLVSNKCSVPVLRKVINCNWYAYASDSFYCVRTKTDAISDGEKIWLTMEKLSEPAKSETVKKVSMDIFDGVNTVDTSVHCEECDWHWEVEREYKNYTRDFDCPKCDWYPTRWSDPLENVYIKVFDKYIRWRLLHSALNVLWELNMSIMWDIFYWVHWEYECIIRPTTDVWNVSNIKIITIE